MASEEIRQERRQRIIDVAETLVRESSGTDFTMVRLAKYARVSAPTPYNLFGSKGAILYALLNQAMDRLTSVETCDARHGHPILEPVRSMENAATFFVSDPELLRPLYKYQLGEYAREERPAYMERAMDYWRAPLLPLAERGILSAERKGGFSVDDFAVTLLGQSIGLLDLWVHAELADEEFRRRMMLSAACIIFPVAAGEDRSLLERIICELQQGICPVFQIGNVEGDAGRSP